MGQFDTESNYTEKECRVECYNTAYNSPIYRLE